MRKYGEQKTTTKHGKAEYMRVYMRDYRKKEREIIRRWRQLEAKKSGS